ncbi:protein suppressor of sable-like isoform X1 [Zerene cesonia]|uniref:protein suppressor of sable-like isoform X1 n=2 Tax=Zerene cesonia TaxID=33412 RepID=UPI0018E55F59|nr:protein suppressor of sable-like isoform X1 [Zerene cesonia]
MTIDSSIISDTLKMAEPASNIDLEDGEIESDGETTESAPAEKSEGVADKEEENPQDENETQNYYYSKSGKRKKSKSSKSEQKYKDKSKKSRKYTNPLEDDFAGNIEKAIRKAMNKNDDSDAHEDEVEERRKHKKRKKYEGKDGPSKKRKKQEYSEEMDENEMMCVRGASPVNKQSQDIVFPEDDRDSYASDSSQDSRGHQQRSQRHRPPQRDRNKNKNDRRRGNHNMQDSEGVCLYYMQGKCHKGDDCIYSHDAQPPRKMELCKFYLMDCCAKRDKCLYMHADFPCKYYHTGLPCIYKDDCKFAHGKPLNDGLKNILLKHIESAPKEILGDFPRLNREDAMKMIQTTQLRLKQQYPEDSEIHEKNIPSLFELNIPNPQNNSDILSNNYNDRQKISPKIRQSRWQNDNNSNQCAIASLSPNSNTNMSSVLSIKNLTGVLTPRQISDLTKLGIENLDQLGQLTVLQLNSIGISLKQITEIQLNTMSIQKLGLINNMEQQSQFTGTSAGAKDLDLRVPPAVPVSNNMTLPTDFPGQDVDMRFQPSMTATASDDSFKNNLLKQEQQPSKDMIDIDQYTKDALKFASKDKENIDISNDTFDTEKPVTSNEIKDVDHRVLPFTDGDSRIQNTERQPGQAEGDTDIRFLPPDPFFKSPAKRNRRSTTDDDEENNLLIDEKWYSSDEEKSSKKKSPCASPQKGFMSPPASAPAPHVIEPSTVLSKLGDLSKIDISEEVTKLLNTMKNNLQESASSNNENVYSSPTQSRDPRTRKSPEKIVETPKTTKKKANRISIYECVDGEPTDGRRRTDVDLRQPDFKPTFGDTDLRQSGSGDIDLRLGLPFKPLPNYTPASEINGSINSHPPIPYKLVPIDIPRPDYTDIKNSTAKSQALVDPRLRKVFRLSVDESNSDSEKPTTKTTTAPSSGPRVDPRRKPKEHTDSTIIEQKQNSLEIQAILQNSNWYKELSTTQKIFVNQHLAPVTQMIKQYHQDKTPGKKFDHSSIQNNSVLCSIFTNLGVSLSESGDFSYLPKPKEALLKTPINFNQNSNPFGNNMTGPPGGMEPNMNMMNVASMNMGGGMNNMNVGHLHGFNQSMPDPRNGPAPGLLGIAPNIPHNFNNNKFGPPNNFGNMGYNGPGNDFNFMEDQNFPRFPNRGGHRGRGNDRWNRGGSNRGQRDRKNFNDRGNWKK